MGKFIVIVALLLSFVLMTHAQTGADIDARVLSS